MGLDDMVNESLKSIAGAVARGVSGRTYGTSGCLEYGNTGNTVITPAVNSTHDLYTSCTGSFTCAQHDEQFHEDFVDFAASRCDDENVFAAHTLLNLDRCLAVAEFTEDDSARRDSETGAYRFCEGGMG